MKRTLLTAIGVTAAAIAAVVAFASPSSAEVAAAVSTCTAVGVGSDYLVGNGTSVYAVIYRMPSGATIRVTRTTDPLVASYAADRGYASKVCYYLRTS